MCRKSAVCSSENVFPSHELGVREDPVGYKLRMLDEVRRGVDETWNEDLSFGQLCVLPDMPVMRMSRIGGLDHVSAGLNLEDEVQYLGEAHIAGMGRFLIAPADVKPHSIFLNATEGIIEPFDPDFDTRSEVLNGSVGKLGYHAVDAHLGSINLEDEPTIDDCAILLRHNLRYRFDVGLVARVILVRQPLRNDPHASGRHKRLRSAGRILRCDQVLDVASEGASVFPCKRPHTGGAWTPGLWRIGPHFAVPLAIAWEIVDEPEGGRRSDLFESLQALPHIVDKAGLTHLAIVDNVYTNLSLLAHRIEYYFSKNLFSLPSGKGPVEEVGRPGQATCVSSKDAVCAALQRFLSFASYLHRIAICANYLTTTGDGSRGSTSFVSSLNREGTYPRWL